MDNKDSKIGLFVILGITVCFTIGMFIWFDHAHEAAYEEMISMRDVAIAEYDIYLDGELIRKGPANAAPGEEYDEKVNIDLSQYRYTIDQENRCIYCTYKITNTRSSDGERILWYLIGTSSSE